MRRFRKLVTMIVAICMCMCMLAACGSKKGDDGNKTEAGSSEQKTYKLAISPYPAFYTWYICEAEDYFTKNDINVELVYFPVYSDSVQAFVSGQVDMISIATPDTIAPYLNGINLETVLILDNSNGADGLVAGAGIETIADLKGKSVATEYGTIEHFFLLKALESAGLTEDDINFVNLSIADSAPAFLSGTVDAASLWEPSLSIALDKEDANLLISSKDVPGLIPDVLVVNRDKVTNDEDIEKMINAYYDAMDFYIKNEDQAIKDMAEGAEITEEEMRVCMSGSKLFSLQESIDSIDSTDSDYTALAYTTAEIADFLYSVKMIESVPDDTHKMLNSKYLKTVLEERGESPVPDTSLK